MPTFTCRVRWCWWHWECWIPSWFTSLHLPHSDQCHPLFHWLALTLVPPWFRMDSVNFNSGILLSYCLSIVLHLCRKSYSSVAFGVEKDMFPTWLCCIVGIVFAFLVFWPCVSCCFCSGGCTAAQTEIVWKCWGSYDTTTLTISRLSRRTFGPLCLSSTSTHSLHSKFSRLVKYCWTAKGNENLKIELTLLSFYPRDKSFNS